MQGRANQSDLTISVLSRVSHRLQVCLLSYSSSPSYLIAGHTGLTSCVGGAGSDIRLGLATGQAPGKGEEAKGQVGTQSLKVGKNANSSVWTPSDRFHDSSIF